ncbi:polysaccharide biosynthesis/export family protein [Altererythrobacter sp. TH136]|uniref:polysaccharide biosynthesis/export family protein n=1 Tax=Altererythrobacter sp. TH136 TaxID=2067415 RepID=UPI001162EE66|nr:polysaccharide biosynthesis/export family protein [Altererythrobacter sp. TH136]QDM41013.1 polysaccharide export protein [Altererythrobacter sp. TH136]
MRFSILALGGALILSGCVSTPDVVPVNGLRVVQTEALPPPSRGDLVASDRESLIGPLDTIAITVYGVEALSTETQVDSSGRIAMPLVGTVDVRGKTAPEVSSFVADRLRQYVKNPQVTVNVRNSASQVVTVDGEVESPGLYPVTNQMTLMRAIASAEGVSEFGNTKDVVVLRTVDGARMAGLYNLGAIRRGVYMDPPIYANDVVVVGDSPQRRLFKDLVSVAPLLTAPLIIALQN